MAVTMKDVAERAGVSKSTVSQYLNKRYNFMSEDTRKKVQQAIEELNYQPNQVARSLKQKRTNVIAVVAATLYSRFTTELVAAIEKTVAKEDIEVIVASTDDDDRKERKCLESLVARQVDGIIAFPTIMNRDIYEEINQQKCPVVFVDRLIEDLSIDAVLLENQEASRLVTDEVIRHGHQRIAILTFPMGKDDSITTRKERLSGYKLALEENNISFDKRYVKSGNLQDMIEKIEELMSLPEPPTAIIASNDLLLELILSWAKEKGVKIPDDLSIASIDDVAFAHFYQPAITTVSQPVTAMGEKAASLLLTKIENPPKNQKSKKEIYRFQPKLIVRESVKDFSTNENDTELK